MDPTKMILKINYIEQEQIKIYCEKSCTKTCYIYRIQQNELLQVVNTESCQNNFMINYTQALTQPIKIVNKKNCLICCQVEYNGHEQLVLTSIDTGAQTNIVSIRKFCEIFPQEQINYSQTELPAVELITANETQLTCLGVIHLIIKIGQVEKVIKFFVIEEGCIILLGVPALDELGLIIDVKRQLCYVSAEPCMASPAVVGQIIKQSAVEDGDKMGGSSPDQFIAENYIIKLTAACKYEIVNLHQLQQIKLEIIDEPCLNKISYHVANIFDCSCITDFAQLCDICMSDSSEYCAQIKPENGRAFVYISYRPTCIMDLEPGQYFFAGVINMNKKTLCKGLATERIHTVSEISAEPPSFTWDGKKLGYEPGGFDNTSIVGTENETHRNELHDNTSNYLDLSSVCMHCHERGETYFCNSTDILCHNVINLESRNMDKDMNNIHCKIKILDALPEDFSRQSLILPFFAGNAPLQDWVRTTFPHWSKESNYICQSKCTLQIKRRETCFQWLICGSLPTIMELKEILISIRDTCLKHEIKQICFIHFDELKISMNYLKRLFCKNSCQINILKRLILNKCMINKVRFGGHVASSAAEKSPVDELNIIDEDIVYIEKFKKLASQMDIEAYPLKSLWAKNSHDIGLVTSGFPDYRILKFNFPIKKDADLIPKPVKTCYVQPGLIEPASQMLQALIDAKIVACGYSEYNAKTHWIPKSRQELTLKQFLEKGGDPEKFVAGMPNTDAPQLLRMVNNFESLNQACYNNPVCQESTTSQLRRISSQMKYCSVVDVCGAFHSIMLSEEAQRLTGFDPGLPAWPRMFYKRVPMGSKSAKNIQDNALLYVLNNIDNKVIYSDNIVILTETKEENYLTVKKVWEALRQHGLKVKASKCTLLCSGKVKLYGFICDMRTGKLQPEQDKISGLRNRAVPTTKKQLKQFLGSLMFYSQIMPLAGKDISILHRCTRGKTFTFGEQELRAFENIQYLLLDSNLLFVYRADPNKKYYLVVDSSLHHTGWLLYQLCKAGHPRVLSYNSKTWGDNFSKYIAALRELCGIICALQESRKEVEHSKEGLVLYTDSLPCVLASVYAKINAKIARYKLFLSGLSWVEINFSPGLSRILTLADYFSRRDDDVQQFTQKLPKECDLVECSDLDIKLAKDRTYTAPKAMYVIDCLLAESTESLLDIENDSYGLDEKGLSVGYCSKKTGRFVCSNVGNSSNVGLCARSDTKIAKDMDAYHVNIVTRSMKAVQENGVGTRNTEIVEQNSTVEPEIKQTNAMLNNPVVIAPTVRTKKVPITIMTENEPERICDFDDYQTEIEAHHNEDNSSFFEAGLETDLGFCKDVSVLLRTQNTPVKDEQGQVNKSEKLDRFSCFYDNLKSTAQYMDKQSLAEAQNFDKFWGQIKEECLNSDRVTYHGKVFFLHDNLLFCRELVKNIEIYKLIIPDLLSLDLVQQSHRHYGCCKVKKLFNQISTTFEIRNLKELCFRVVKECFTCSLTANQPCGTVRQSLPKNPKMLMGKNLVWALDELQIVSAESGQRAGFHKVLVACDLFSHFCIIAPVVGVLDSKQVLQFLQYRIIAVFGIPLIIVTDNQSCMDSGLIKDVCQFLHIEKTTISPYDSRANLSELINRLILDCLRALSVTHYMKPDLFSIVLASVITLVNGLVFQDEKILSPYFIQFAQRPQINILSFFEGDLEFCGDRDQYLKMLIIVNKSLTEIRVSQLERRTYKSNSKRVQDYYDRIQCGSIVSILNPEVIIKKQDFKLRPKYKNRFLVAKRTKSSVFLVPCDEVYLEHFYARKNNLVKEPLFYYKADISNIKLLTNILIVNSNKKQKFYNHFQNNHSVPPTFYYNKTESGAQLRQLHDFQSDEDLCEELSDTVNRINKIRTFFNNSSLMSGILRTARGYREEQIFQISALIKGAHRKKRVKFYDFVESYRLVCPDTIYFALTPKFVKINDEYSLPIKTISNNHYCVCSKCRKDIVGCEATPCGDCFGKQVLSKSE